MRKMCSQILYRFFIRGQVLPYGLFYFQSPATFGIIAAIENIVI